MHDDAFERDAGNLQFSRHLRIHHILAPGDALIVAPVDVLYMKTFLLWQFHLLCMETRQVGHFSIELCQFYKRIHLIGQQDRFLLMHTCLIGTHPDEEVVVGDRRPSLPHWNVVPEGALLPPDTVTLTASEEMVCPPTVICAGGMVNVPFFVPMSI